MADQVQQFLNQLEDASDPGDIDAIKSFIEDVQEVFEEILGGGFSRVDVLTDVDSDSLSFRLQDEEEIAEYELFSIHTDGSIDFYFTVDTEDYHQETFGFDALENNPTSWCQATFDRLDGININELLEMEDEFIDELTSAIDNFSLDVNTIMETDDEVDQMERDLGMNDPNPDPDLDVGGGGPRETF